MRLFIPLALCFACAGCSCDAEVPCVDDGCGDEGLCSEGTCVAPCSLDAPCDDGFTCVKDASPQGSHCLPITGDSDVDDACDDDQECASGACAAGRCVATCTLDVPCPAALRCVLDGPRRLCVPPAGDLDDGALCSDSAECLSGTCVRPPIPVGEAAAVCAAACDVDHACDDDADLCLALLDGGRACLPPLDDGAPCAGGDTCTGGFCIEDRAGPICASPCDNGTCAAATFVCVDDDEGNALCLPEFDSRADGEACTDRRECQSRTCGNFVDGGTSVELCASPCPAEGCGPDRVCWEADVGDDLCGPIP
ncbi:MAG: hypothetical protein Q8O67_07275 [Deltaproteobacteria bacterium]|nr:hypothetical protein [Deltaproteobacteria bacterium]